MINTDFSVTGGTTTTGTALTGTTEMDQDDFLLLLVTELQNQDPLDPMSNQEFVGQLTDLSSLEQLQNLAALLEASLAYDQTNLNAQSLSLIGKEVRAEDSTIEYTGEGSVALYTEVDEKTDIVVKIYDEDGEVVYTAVLEDCEGVVKFEKDWAEDLGLEEGDYTVSFDTSINTDGETQEFTVYCIGVVQGVDFTSGDIMLDIGGNKVNMADVIEIMQEGGNSRWTQEA